MKLNKKTLHRLLIGFFMLLPIIITLGEMISYFAGAHGAALPNAYDYWNGGIMGQLLDAYSGGVGFGPFKDLLSFLNDNMLNYYFDDFVGYMVAPYLYWCMHVVLFDLIFYVATFFVRFIKKIIDKLEGE